MFLFDVLFEWMYTPVHSNDLKALSLRFEERPLHGRVIGISRVSLFLADAKILLGRII